MTEVVIAGFARSPFTPARKGTLAKVRPDDLLAQVIKGLVRQTGVTPDEIEDLIVGCAFPEGEQGLNMARMGVFLAGLPIPVAGTTVNRFCGSSMQSIHMAAGAIRMGAGEAFICAGVESMTRIPMGGFNPAPNPKLAAEFPQAYISMGITAENLAKKYDIDRKRQQEFAVQSHAKAAAAQAAGKFAEEIVPIVEGNIRIEQDGSIRADTTQEVLDGLQPAFDQKGTVTAGTSSPLTDGAAAVLVCSEDYADRRKLSKLARIRAIAVAGVPPEIMGIGPVAATEKALKRGKLELDQVDLIEINEAFAAQAEACLVAAKIPHEKINLDGGAIALGHPLGASGARITGKAAQLLKREGKRYGLATMCIGGGQGIATLLEAC
jgi:acetyl-CoA acyltransferase